MQKGNYTSKKLEECDFLVTDGFKNNITNLLRAISNCDHPVLLEGPTSAGKTSLVKFLAELSGNKCVRINNHQNTDIEEYIGNHFILYFKYTVINFKSKNQNQSFKSEFQINILEIFKKKN